MPTQDAGASIASGAAAGSTMGPWGAVAGGGIAALGAAGLFGKKKNNAKALMEQILAQYNGVNVPGIEEQKIILSNLVQQGLVTPEDAATVELGPSAYEGINLDPRAKQAQYAALEELQGSVDAGGLNPVDLSRIREVSDRFETERRGAEGAVMENARERGVSGSNLELVNRLLAGQSAATRASREGMDVAALAHQSKMDAIKSMGEMGTNIRGQEFGEASTTAAAKDAITRFNAGNRQAQINLNVGGRNEAQRLNLGEKQRVADTNTQQGNANTVRNSELIQKKYDNDLALADAKARALAGIAGTANDEQKSKDQLYASLIGLGGNVISTYK